MKFDRMVFAAKHRADIMQGEAARRDREFDLMCRVIREATDLVNADHVSNNPTLPSFTVSLARLADAVHAHWKFQRGDE